MRMRIERIEDYLRLAGDLVVVQKRSGDAIKEVVQDVSDTGKHLVLLPAAGKKAVTVPLAEIELVEIEDSDPGFTRGVRSRKDPRFAAEAARQEAEERVRRSAFKLTYTPGTGGFMCVFQRNRARNG